MGDHHHSRWPRFGEMKEGPFFSFVQRGLQVGILSDRIFWNLRMNDTRAISILLSTKIQISFNSWRPGSTLVWLLLDEVVCFGCHWRPIFLPLRIHSIHHAFRINRTTHPIYSLFVFLCKVQGKNRHTAVKISHTTTYRDVIYKWEVKRLRLR